MEMGVSMGYEYETQIEPPLTNKKVEQLFDKLASTSGWEVVSREQNKMSLRFTHRPLDQTWPQDFDIQCDGQSLYTVFHGAEQKDRVDSLGFISSILESDGITCVFEEI